MIYHTCFPRPLPKLRCYVRRQRRQQKQEGFICILRHAGEFLKCIKKYHERGDCGIEFERVQVLGHVPMNPSPAEKLADYPERHGAVFRFDQDGSPAAWVAINAPRDFAMILMEEKAPKAMT